jgi:sec-independent protein translocase protein TatB
VFDVGAPELLLLVVIAVILFGPEKLPEFARKAARLIRYVRNLAGNAQQQLSQELGTDVDLRDLNPKAFVQKHLLDDVEPLVADVKKEITQVSTIGGTAATEVTDAINSAKAPAVNGTSTPARVLTPFDPDAT